MPIFTRFKKQSIGVKLFFGFAVLVVLSTFIQIIGFNLINGYIAAHISSIQNEKANEAAQKIESFFTNIDINNAGLAKIYIANGSKNDRIDTVTVYAIENNDYIRKISFLSSFGKELLKFDRSKKVSENELSFEISTKPFQAALAGKPTISKVYFLNDEPEPYIDLFSPISKKNASGAAVIKTQVKLAKLWNVISQTKFGEHGHAYIVDDEGRLIAHPNERYLMSRPTLNPTELTIKDYQYRNENNVAVIANSAKVPHVNWLTIFEQPTSEAFSFLNFLRKMSYITIIGSFLLLLAISILISNNLTHNIKLLKLATQSLEKGHLDIRSAIKSGDEIEELGNAFNMMAGKLEESFKRLEEEKIKSEKTTELVIKQDNEIRAVTRNLQIANNRLQQLDKLKDEFVSLASHELRTPMTAIKYYLWFLLEDKSTFNEKQMAYIDRAYSSTDRLINLVNDMLNVSRIEGGRMIINKQLVNLKTLAQDVIAEVLPTAQKQKLSVVIGELPENLPAVNADIEKIKQVLINLVGNSLKFTPSGGTITISFTKKDGFIETAVHDTGLGISNEDISKLFVKFGMIGNNYLTKQNTQGTGLGLYISKSIIELHGGKIWAESEGLNKGTTFRFTLQIANQKIVENKPEEKQIETKTLEAQKLAAVTV